ncbi:SET domain-containing protein-lysine N-methyltransferase [Iningainema tapete]|uniref:SET domain-containing protein-lysine N-methyltransferase n=1 Tax=Iningainema tapete BLCC-T55 TaxID=2748662 RepID=A0A8J6XNE1_9CYAN|nr:SET domain-containing protein-lysine N-methyltransferase [Iningainema tapete]MBD2774231.1 SET domain-containing protein-lysine N-methyltransferase [Iningainema tapete BLCC-T55]
MLQVQANTTAKGTGLITTSAIKKGTVFYKITNYEIIHQPTYTSVQVGLETHMEEPTLRHLNHSCSPNIIIDTVAFECRALRDIEPYEELSFFYPSTEWDMNRPFVCLCGSPQCIRIIIGAKYQSLDTLSRYFINRHVHTKALNSLQATVLEQGVVVEPIDDLRIEEHTFSLLHKA